MAKNARTFEEVSLDEMKAVTGGCDGGCCNGQCPDQLKLAGAQPQQRGRRRRAPARFANLQGQPGLDPLGS